MDLRATPIRLRRFGTGLRQERAIDRTAGLGFHWFGLGIAKNIFWWLGYGTFGPAPAESGIGPRVFAAGLRGFWGSPAGDLDPAAENRVGH